MAPLPHNNTPIYFVDYSVGGETHTMEVRAAAPVSPSTFGTNMNAFLDAIDALFNQITILGVRFQAAGTNFSNPVVTGIEGNVYGSGAGTDDQVPIALNFVGRSSGGRRVRLMVFGFKFGLSGYRLSSVESPEVASGVALLNSTPNMFLAIDGVDPVWYPYANSLVNAYWQRKVRA